MGWIEPAHTMPPAKIAGCQCEELVIPGIDYGVPFHSPRSPNGTRAHVPWRTVGSEYYMPARLMSKNRTVPGDDRIFRIKLSFRTDGIDLDENSDEGPSVAALNRESIISWQFDYDVFFSRSKGGRRILQLWGLDIDKFRNAKHPAHAFA